MRKKYYVVQSEFRNAYTLFYAYPGDSIPECAERITRKEAERLAREERERRRYNMGGFASANIVHRGIALPWIM